MTDALTKQCRKCGRVLAVAEFHLDGRRRDGRKPDCRLCRNAALRVQQAARTVYGTVSRLPDVLGQSSARLLSEDVLGVLRDVYGNRPTLLLADCAAALRDVDPEVRLRASITLLALREIADALARPPIGWDELPQLLADVPDAEVAELIRQREIIVDRRRGWDRHWKSAGDGDGI